MHRTLLSNPHISSYSFCLLLGFIVGYAVARWNAKRLGMATRHVDNLTLLLVITGLCGARIFSWLFYFPPGTNLWQALIAPGGGLVFYGGVIFGIMTVCGYALIARIRLSDLGDILAAPLALGLVFGRIGCFMAGCCWGDLCIDKEQVDGIAHSKARQAYTVPAVSPANFPLAVRFPQDSSAFRQHQKLGLLDPHAVRSRPVHPVQLYEAAAALLLVLWLQARLKRRSWPGEIAVLFCLGYGLVRFGLEFLRADNTPAYLGLTISQVVSLFALAAAAGIGVLRGRSVAFAVPAPVVAPSDTGSATALQRSQ